MLSRLNRALRKSILVAGAAVLLIKVLDTYTSDGREEIEEETGEKDFQEKEFDDIW